MRGTTRKSRVLLALALALCLAFTAALPALAAQIPSRPETQYVLDEAGVLSEETKDNINHANRELSRETGACVMVAVVNSLGGEDLDFYTSWMFESWKAGATACCWWSPSKRKNTKFWLGKAWAMPWAGTGWKTWQLPRWSPVSPPGSMRTASMAFLQRP